MRRSNDGGRRLLTLLRNHADRIIPGDRFFHHPRRVSLAVGTLDQPRLSNSALPIQLSLSHVNIVNRSFKNCATLTLTKTAFSDTKLARHYPPDILALGPSLLLRYRTITLNGPSSHLTSHEIGTILITGPVNDMLFKPSNCNQLRIPIVVITNTISAISPTFPRRIRPFA